MAIQTDSTPLEEPKNPDTCNVFSIYKLLATKEEVEQMKANYLAGGYGYGHAKTALFQLILEKFAEPREKFNYYINNLTEVEQILKEGAIKASKIAENTLKRVREKIGY